MQFSSKKSLKSTYLKVNTSRLEAHVDIYRLLMKGIVDAYVFTVTFWHNVDFWISNTR